MITAVVQLSGRPLVVLGLSGENVTRLMADEPILIDLADLGLPPQKIAIVGGRTEDDIAADLKRHSHMTARVSYFFGGLWLWECTEPRCPVIETAESPAEAGDEAREHIAQHHSEGGVRAAVR